MHKFSSIISRFVLLTMLPWVIFGQEMQYIAWHSESTCDSRRLVTRNMTEVEDSSTIPINCCDANKPYMSLKGLWGVQYCLIHLNNTLISCGNWEVNFGTGVECTPYDSTEKGRFIRIRRYGDSFQNTTTFTYFSEPNFNGTRHEFNGSDLQNNEHLVDGKVGSYFFSGSESWMWFTQQSFQGESKCLKPSENAVADGYGISFQLNAGFNVGSIAVGCVPHSSSSTGVILSGIINLNNIIIFYILIYASSKIHEYYF